MYVIILLFVFFCFCFGPFFLYPCHSFPDGHFWFSLANDGTWILGYMKQINYAQTVENEERRWRGSGFVLEYICFVLVSIHELFFHCVYNLSLTSPLECLLPIQHTVSIRVSAHTAAIHSIRDEVSWGTWAFACVLIICYVMRPFEWVIEHCLDLHVSWSQTQAQVKHHRLSIDCFSFWDASGKPLGGNYFQLSAVVMHCI